MSWGKVKLSKVLRQYRFEHIVQNDADYKQVTISKHDGVCFRGFKKGHQIGRKRQFIINLDAFPNTLMFVRQGVYEGAIGIAPEEVNGCIATENMPMFSIEDIDKEFLNYIIKSPYFKSEISRIPTTGSAQKSIHERQLLQIEIPYPSIDEQRKIVELLNRNETAINKLLNKHIRQLDLLKKLRQQILQDAVKGSLVPQDPNDEPASKLLERIKAEKEKLVWEKKIKKEKPLPPINPQEVPFLIPENWIWCRGNELAEFIDPQPSHRTPPEVMNGIPYISMKDISEKGTISFLSARKVSSSVLIEHNARYTLKEGDFIFGKIGTIGKPVWLTTPFNYTLSANIILIQANRKIINERFLFYFLSSPIAEKHLYENKSEMSYPVFGMKKARLMPIPCPSLEEQNRIVSKIEQLMSLCDELEQSIQQNQMYTKDLLQVALKEALEPKN